MSPAAARVTPRGAERWVRGHPWIYRSEVTSHPADPGVVPVEDPRGRFIGQALLSPRSEIRLRLLERTDRAVDAAWWHERLAAAVARREGIDATACRLVHGEGDALPSLVLDSYDRYLVGQLLSAGLETQRPVILSTLRELLRPAGVLLRHDVPVRRREGLSDGVELVEGEVPREIEVREGGVRYLAAPWDGQKTGAFLDQRPQRLLAGALTRPGGRALDCFTYHGSFALHLAGRAAGVLALDVSGSMNASLGDVKDAARAFLKALRPQDRVTLVAFNDAMFTLSRGVAGTEALPALEKLAAWGGTSLYDVVVRSMQLLSKKPGKHAVVIFSDGDDNASQANLQQVRRLTGDSDAMLMAVGLGRGSEVDNLKETLESLAEASGGRVLFAKRSDELVESFGRVVEDLINQYTLGFEPQRDGRDHQIRVEVPGRSVRVRARSVYVAPS